MYRLYHIMLHSRKRSSGQNQQGQWIPFGDHLFENVVLKICNKFNTISSVQEICITKVP